MSRSRMRSPVFRPMHPNLIPAIIISTMLTWHGHSKKNLTSDALLSTFITGLVVFTFSPISGVLLSAFYYTSSKLTHFKSTQKQKIEVFTTVRNSTQVLTNSIWVSLASIYLYFNNDPKVMYFVMGVVCCCCGDTWASEIGSVYSSEPRLVTNFKPVVAGTNGAVSIVGLVASIAGGGFIGLCYVISSKYLETTLNLSLLSGLVLGGALGFVGSMIDSLLGATLQATYYCLKTKRTTHAKSSDTVLINGMPILSNESVNLISSLLTGLLCYYMA